MENLGLLASASEDEGVAALEACHRVSLEGLVDKDLVDLALGKRVVAALLADVDEAGVLPCEPQDVFACQVVIDHHVGPRRDCGAPSG